MNNHKQNLMDIQHLSRIELGGVVKAGLTPLGDKSKSELVVEIPITQEKLMLSKEEMKSCLEKGIQCLSPNRQFRIDTTMLAFSLNADLPKSEFNTMLLLNIPYVFYLPDYFAINLNYPAECRIKFIKQWTERVKDSDRFDAVSEKRLYYRNFNFKTPKLPLDVTNGPNINFTGKNIEKEDNNGEYRYSTLLIELDTNFSVEELKDNKLILEKIQLIVREIVVYLTRIYKYCSKSFNIRFRQPTLLEIFFPQRNLGFYVIDGALIRDATVTLSKSEIDQFESLSESGFEPTLYEMLLMDSKSAFLNLEYKLAILEAFQSMDVFLEDFIRTSFKKKGILDAEIDRKLDQSWKTRDRIEKLVAEISGKGLSQIDGKLGSSWHCLYEDVRNAMIHKGYLPSKKETMKVININESVMQLIKSLN